MPLQHTAVTKQHFSCNHKILAILTNAEKYKSYFINDLRNPTKKATLNPEQHNKYRNCTITVQLCSPATTN